MRLHIPGIPYTITRGEYSHDAFTGKVLRFSKMMRSRGFEVYHYGIETSESGATKQIDIMTKNEWTELRIKTWQFLDNKLSYEDAVEKNKDDTLLINQLSNWNSPLTEKFNARFRNHLIKHYRDVKSDIVCSPLGRTYQEAFKDLDFIFVETGIGYSGSYLNYRIFESHTWLARTIGEESKNPPNYWFTIPNYYDIDEFKLSLTPNSKKVGFLGRIGDYKGCRIICEIAKRFPDVEFVLCGQGDPTPYVSNNVIYKRPIHGHERSIFLGDCIAFLYPTIYLEPFGGGAVEAQLCGTPVICSDFGAMTETVEQFKTGVRCHTLSDYCHGIQMALDNKFDRTYIRERAANLYDMYNIAKQYEYVFKSIREIYIPNAPDKNGWYSYKNLIKTLTDETPPIEPKPRIYIFVVYYGIFPNYFQLYLDSLAINQDCLTVFLITDIDLSTYNCPANLMVIDISKIMVQQRVADVIETIYHKKVAPESLIVDNYKIVDIKIMYPILFDDILKKYNVTEKDYVGWGDIDLIYGKLSDFMDLTIDYGIIGGWHGHFVAIKNEVEFKNNFKEIEDYLYILTDNSKTYISDEIAYRQPLIDYLKKHNLQMFYTNAYFCDIVPPCFYERSRPNWKSYTKNFYDLYNPTKNIHHIHYNSKLTVHYDDGTRREALYCHMQKRKMTLPFTNRTSYHINETGFSVIPLHIWQTWHTSDLPEKMNECIETLKRNHPTFHHTLMDTDDCRNFIRTNFSKEVVNAYDALIPHSYKSDLWRFCVLYIHGGIYMDVKLQFETKSLHDFIDKEYYVYDGCHSTYTGFMVLEKGNPLLLDCIVHILYNVSTQYYGTTPWCVTGPKLLGKHCYGKPHELGHYGITGQHEYVSQQETNILSHYKEYRQEQKGAYYADLWKSKKIYRCSIDLNDLPETLKQVLDRIKPLL